MSVSEAEFLQLPGILEVFQSSVVHVFAEGVCFDNIREVVDAELIDRSSRPMKRLFQLLLLQVIPVGNVRISRTYWLLHRPLFWESELLFPLAVETLTPGGTVYLQLDNGAGSS